MKQEDYIRELECDVGRFYSTLITLRDSAVESLISPGEVPMPSFASVLNELKCMPKFVSVVRENGHSYVSVANPEDKDGGTKMQIGT